jgi:hypothetical protein
MLKKSLWSTAIFAAAMVGCNSYDTPPLASVNCPNPEDATCAAVVNANTCAGATAPTLSLTGNTPGATFTIPSGDSKFQGSCGGNGPEVVYQLNVPSKVDLNLQAQVTGVPASNVVLYLRKGTCDTADTEVACQTVPSTTATSSAAATIAVHDLEPGTYFLFIDTNSGGGGASTTPGGGSTTVTIDINLQIAITQIISGGGACTPGSATNRCATGQSCVVGGPSGYQCGPSGVTGTSLFVVDSSNYISQLDPANGVVVKRFPTPFTMSGTEHYALAYDDIRHRLFLTDSYNENLHNGTKVKHLIFVINSQTGALISTYPVPAGTVIEGASFNNTGNKLVIFDAAAGRITIIDADTGSVSFGYPVLTYSVGACGDIGGLGIDPSGANNGPLPADPTRHGYVTCLIENAIKEFVVGVGGFIRSFGAPAALGRLCGMDAHAGRIYLGYSDGVIRVVQASNGQYITEFRAPGHIHACGIGAGAP